MIRVQRNEKKLKQKQRKKMVRIKIFLTVKILILISSCQGNKNPSYYSHNSIYKSNKIDTLTIIDNILNTKNVSSNDIILETFKNIEHFVIDDSTYLKKYNGYFKSNHFNTLNRINSREDIGTLFFIYFNLFLEYKKHDNYDLAFITLIDESCRNKILIQQQSKFDLYYFSYLGNSHCEIGNSINFSSFPNTSLPIIVGQEHVQLEKHLNQDTIKINYLFKHFSNWQNRVKELGSLEKARKLGLDPMKNSGFRWRLTYFHKDGDDVKIRNSYFPRYKTYGFFNSSEIRSKEWESSYPNEGID